MSAGYVAAPAEQADMEEIWEFYAERNPETAGDLLADLILGMRAIAASPGIGHRRRDLTDKPLRFWSVRGHLIVYNARQSRWKSCASCTGHGT